VSEPASKKKSTFLKMLFFCS